MSKSLILTVILLSVVSCGRKPDSSARPAETVDLVNGATIAGTVALDGECPADALIPSSSDKACHCSTVTAGHWIVHDGKVTNAFIFIKDGLGDRTYAAPPAGGPLNGTREPVVLDQKGCIYSPHVMGAMLGQTLKILNSDSTLHNVHLTSTNAGECSNRLFPQGMAPMEQKMTTPEIMKTIKCDVHSWMNCYVGVLPHPFFAVSDTNGHYEIRGLPPGEYTIELWHESSTGNENPIVETQKVTVAARDSKKADFKIVAR